MKLPEASFGSARAKKPLRDLVWVYQKQAIFPGEPNTPQFRSTVNQVKDPCIIYLPSSQRCWARMACLVSMPPGLHQLPADCASAGRRGPQRSHSAHCILRGEQYKLLQLLAVGL